MIIYLHGFRSSPASVKAQKLQRHMTERGLGNHFYCPQLPVGPAHAVALAEKAIRACVRPPTLAGSSLGGFYATWLAEKFGLKAVLVNPAVQAPVSLRELVGSHTNLYTGEQFEFTRDHVDELKRLDVARITYPGRYLVILGTADEVLDYRAAVTKYEGARQILVEGGDHGLAEFEQHLDAVVEFATQPGGA